MDPNTNTEENPAATIANAAMNGATPVVTTTDLNAADVSPEPTLQAPVLDTSVLDVTALGAAPAPAPETAPVLAPSPEFAATAAPTVEAPAAETPAVEGPVSLAPSADFQMGEVSTVSAVQNGADGNLAAANDNEIMIGQPLEPENPTDDPTVDQLANTEVGSTSENIGEAPADFNDPEAAAAAEAEARTAKDKDDEDDEPIVAAAPVPGSIGSAKSYADIQRAEAEKAAKVAAKQGSGNINKNVIMIAAIAVVAVIGIIVGALAIFGGGSSAKPTNTTTNAPAPVAEEHDLSTLSCKRNLALEEYASYGAISGMQENIFYFKDDTLNGLVTDFSYTYASKALADIWRDKLALDYGVTPNSGMDEESAIAGDEEDDEEETKATAEMLYQYVNTKDLTVIHGMFIRSKDIEVWLASDAYSDVTYGATENGAIAPVGEDEEVDEEEEVTDDDGEVIRNLKYYNRLQNSIDYTCSISKGY